MYSKVEEDQQHFLRKEGSCEGLAGVPGLVRGFDPHPPPSSNGYDYLHSQVVTNRLWNELRIGDFAVDILENRSGAGRVYCFARQD